MRTEFCCFLHTQKTLRVFFTRSSFHTEVIVTRHTGHNRREAIWRRTQWKETNISNGSIVKRRVMQHTVTAPKNHKEKVSYLVSWCFEPSQPDRITSGLTRKRNVSQTNRWLHEDAIKQNVNQLDHSSGLSGILQKLLPAHIKPLSDNWRRGGSENIEKQKKKKKKREKKERNE